MAGSPARTKCEVLSKPHTSRCVDVTRDARPAEGAAVAQSMSKAAPLRALSRAECLAPIGALRPQAAGPASTGHVAKLRLRSWETRGCLFLYGYGHRLHHQTDNKGERIGNSMMMRAKWPSCECRAPPSSTKPAFWKRLSHRPPVSDAPSPTKPVPITRFPTEARVSETSV
jgi:hypothetical protein